MTPSNKEQFIRDRDDRLHPERRKRWEGRQRHSGESMPRSPLTHRKRNFCLHSLILLMAGTGALIATISGTTILSSPETQLSSGTTRTLTKQVANLSYLQATPQIVTTGNEQLLQKERSIVQSPDFPIRPATLSTITPSPDPTPTPPDSVMAVEPDPTPTPKESFYSYVVQPGDSVAAIADSFGVDLAYVLWNNPEVGTDPDLLLAGQELIIPGTNGLLYEVKLNDNLSDIADFYDTDVASIISFIPNDLSSPNDIIEGRLLLLPEAVPPTPTPIPTEPTPIPTEPTPIPTEPTPTPTPEAPIEVAFVWPFEGPISSPYGEDRGGGVAHRGLDIDGFGRHGDPVVASADGQVILVAEQTWGLGNHIIIQHADGTETIYAHLSAFIIEQGQFVTQGEEIGAIGNTGYSFGDHLHFEVRVGGIAVNPLAYLP